jgi:tRNA-modifying protein YgfZ
MNGRMTAQPRSHATDDARALAAAAETSVLLVPLRDRAAIVATGKDTVSWLNGLVTCDLAKRAAGEAAYGLLVEKKGRLRADLFVVPQRGADKPTLALLVPAAKRDEVMALLDHHLIMEDVELTTTDLVAWSAFGPKAAVLLGTDLGAFAGPVDLLGRGGAVFAARAGEEGATAEGLLREVAARGGAVADESGWERVRIEAALPRFGVEVDDTLYPQEASLEKLAVSFSKGCYLGQEVVYMLENRGHVKRKLVALDVEGDAAPATGDAVTTPEGDVIGDVRSGAIGASRGMPVAIAMVKWAHAKAGTEVRVGERVARVREAGVAAPA